LIDLRLYVSHRTGSKDRVIRQLEAFLAAKRCDYRLEVINLLDQPDRALDDLVLVTPTLIRRRPSPNRRVCGDLSDAARVIRELDLPVVD
jgi:circadian clock protein KaiB